MTPLYKKDTPMMAEHFMARFRWVEALFILLGLIVIGKTVHLMTGETQAQYLALDQRFQNSRLKKKAVKTHPHEGVPKASPKKASKNISQM